MSYIEGFDRNQGILIPEYLDDYVKKNDIVRVIDAYVEQLDVKKLSFGKAEPPTLGRPCYNPKDLLKLYIYGYLKGIRSSRQLEILTQNNMDVIWLMRKLSPDHKTIAEFRRNNQKPIKLVFKDFVKLCDELDLYGKTTVAIDGTKIRANNSKKNNYNKKKINRHKKYIDEKIENYLKALDEADKTEEELKTSEMLDVKEIEEKIKSLMERKDRFEELEEQLEESGQSEISLVDKDARLMPIHHGHIEPGYNIQTTVDSKHKLIVDFEVIQNPTDQGQLLNMSKRAKKRLKAKRLTVLADKGYYNYNDILGCLRRKITPYVSKQIAANSTKNKNFYADKFTYDPKKDGFICPAGKLLNKKRKRTENKKHIGYGYGNPTECQSCSLQTKCTTSETGRTIFRHKKQARLDRVSITKPENFKTYRLRQTIVEHPFGTIKRSWNTNYFLTRGKKSVTAEMALTFIAYNFKRAVNILGVEAIIEKLKDKNELVMA